MPKYKYKVTRLDDSSCVVTDLLPTFRKFYKDNTVVTAAKRTLGLMVFHRKKDAQEFIRSIEQNRGWKIKRVIPLSRGKTPESIPQWMDIIRFYARLLADELSQEDKLYGKPPSGTICYHKLKVIGDC